MKLRSILGAVIPRATKIKLGYLAATLRNRLRGYRDFYSFPFYEGTPLNDKAAGTMEEACGFLEHLGIEYYICDGTALGLVRAGQFIPHDNDIDVAVLGEIDIPAVKRVFLAAGYKVGREVYFRNKLQQLIFYSRDQVIFDICLWRDRGDGYAYHFVPEIEKGRRQLCSNFSGADMIPFCGRSYPTHPNIREWLRAHYGDDWMTPRSARGDWRDEVQDIIK